MRQLEARWWDEYRFRRATGATHEEYMARRRRPRLTIRKGSGGWSWWVTDENGRMLASDFDAGFNAWRTTHAEALAVGLAALEAASVGRQQVG